MFVCDVLMKNGSHRLAFVCVTATFKWKANFLLGVGNNQWRSYKQPAWILKGQSRRSSGGNIGVDHGICNTSRQNEVCKGEAEQRAKAEGMQQSIFPRQIRLIVVQEAFIKISQQCHE